MSHLHTPAKLNHFHQELTTQPKTGITHNTQQGTHQQQQQFDYFAFTQQGDKWRLTQSRSKHKNSINYRQKTYELMNQIVKLRILESGYKIEIETLRNQIASQSRESEKLLASIGCSRLEDIYEIVSSQTLLKDKNKKIEDSNQEMKKLISHYKHKEIQDQVERDIDQYQSEFASKLRAKPKSAEQLKCEAVQQENQNLTNKLTSLQKQNEQFRLEISKLHRNLSDLQLGIKDKKQQQTNEGQRSETNSQSRKKYPTQHKQNYRDDEKKQFSFGRRSEPDLELAKEPFQSMNNMNMDENVSERMMEMEMNLQCYKASIDGLLEENKKLKQSFESLYKMKQGQAISDELQKEINIMKSIIQLSHTLEQKN